MSTAVIAGGGPGGLYLAWRLLTDSKKPFDNVQIYEMSPDRIGGRIFTKTFADNGYVDCGGMRYSDSQQIINKVITDLGLTNTTEFVETKNRLLYLRGQHIYQSQISTTKRVPYNNNRYNYMYVDDVFGALSKQIVGTSARSRQQWCDFLESGTIPSSFDSLVYPSNTNVGNIGYWNLMIDYLGSEAFKYCADAGGYTSNIINWNAADAIPYNSEFAGTGNYYRFRGGYSTFINALANKVSDLGGTLVNDRRLISFDSGTNNTVDCHFEDSSGETYPTVTGDALFLAMPRRSVELVRSTATSGSLSANLGNKDVRLLLESVIEQPSYKIAISFKSDWWNSATYKPNLSNNAWGPTVTDLPLRQIYYFNPEENAPNTYSMLAAYDDMRFTRFWQELEVPLADRRTDPLSLNFQPLGNGQELTQSMKAMVAEQLAEIHYASSDVPAQAELILDSMKEAYFMDWSLDPFGAGYHAWAAHTSACNVMTNIRKPLASVNANAPVYLTGSAYSNDQAWVEGAFCTAESVLVDYFGFSPIVTDPDYPLICKC